MNRVHLRRRTAAGAVLLALATALATALVLGVRGSGDPAPLRARAAPPPTPTPRPAQLPGGGRHIFPGRRVVAFYGNPADDQLGVLGIGSPARAARRLLRQALA